MKGFKTEFIVGVFAMLVFAVMALITFKVTDLSFTKKDGRLLYASFRNIAGLDKNTKIKIAGVDSGVVEEIKLVEGRARIGIRLYPGVKAYTDATASIKASGLLGDKFIEVEAGSLPPELKDGENIRNVRELADIDELIKNLTEVSVDLGGFVSELNKQEFKDSLAETVENLRAITTDIRFVMAENKEKITQIVNRIRSLTANLDRLVQENRAPLTNSISNIEAITTGLRRDTPELIADIKSSAADLRRILENTGPRIESTMAKADMTLDSVNDIANKISRGEGTIGKLVNDDTLYSSFTNAVKSLESTLSGVDRFRTFITFKGEHMPGASETKGNLNITLQPRKDKYYILGVVSNPINKTDTSISDLNGTIFTEQRIENKMEFTLQFAKRFNDTALRIGLTENTFGLGADRFFMRDRLMLSLDAWDFTNEEYLASSPHLRFGADIFATKYIFLSGGYDNPLNDNRSGLFAGAGLRFEDEDLKYLFGSMPLKP